MYLGEFKEKFKSFTGFKDNPFHPFVWVNGDPIIGKNVYIGFFSVVNAKDCLVEIGDNCDFAPFVSINTADSHLRCVELKDIIVRKPIIIENNVFIGTQSVINNNVKIGHHSVIASCTCVESGSVIPPYSLVKGNPMQILHNYYKPKDNGKQ